MQTQLNINSTKITSLENDVGIKLKTLDDRFDIMEEKVENVEQKMEEKVENVEQKIAEHDESLHCLNKDFDKLKTTTAAELRKVTQNTEQGKITFYALSSKHLITLFFIRITL